MRVFNLEKSNDDIKKINDDIKEHKFERVYLFCGAEKFLKKKYCDDLTKAIIPDGAEMMNLDVFLDKRLEVGSISDACETLPFMNDFRLVIVKDSELFDKGNKIESDKLAEYVKNIPETTVLIFIEDKIDKRSKLYNAVSKNGIVVEFGVPKEKDLVTWVKKVAKKRGLIMQNDVVYYFIRNINDGMEAVLAEIEKLADYVGQGEVTEKHIDDICTKSLEVNIFNMVKAIGNKKLEDAIDIYNNMLLMKESPIKILAMISRQFKIILQSKYLSEKGFYKSDIAKKINQREFTVAECLIQAKQFKKKVLLQALNDCLECDVNIKTGKIQERLGVEMIIMKYAS